MSFKFISTTHATTWSQDYSNASEYRKQIMEFASRWALEMEHRMSHPCKSLDDISEDAACAVADGITYQMYLAAKSALQQYWVYGDLL